MSLPALETRSWRGSVPTGATLPRLHDAAGQPVDPEAWDALLVQAATPNVFHGSRVVGAHLAHGLAGSGQQLLACRDGSRLVALLPFCDRRSLLRKGVRVFSSPFAPDGTPLLDGRDPVDAASRLLAAMASARPGAIWHFPRVALGSTAGRALLDVLRVTGRPHAVTARFQRAVLDRQGRYAAYAEAHLSRSRRKSLRRSEARLAAQGVVAHEVATSGDALAAAVETFLGLEASGWKGRRGTAFANDPKAASFAHALYRAGSDATRIRADLLTLDGRAIAASLALQAGRTCYLHKAAFNEDFRAYAPGILLENTILRAFHDTAFADRLDSLGSPGDILEELLVGRQEIGDLLLAADAMVPASAMARAAAFERRRTSVLEAVKRWRLRLT